MKNILTKLYRFIADSLRRESKVPPFPFDDPDFADKWQEQRQDAENEKAVDKQIKQWQQDTSRR